MASLQFKHGSYYAVFSKNGRKKWINIGKVKKRQAKKILNKLEVEFAKDRLDILDNKPISLFDYIDNYLDYARTNKAESTYKREIEALKVIKPFFGNTQLKNIDTHSIECYKLKGQRMD